MSSASAAASSCSRTLPRRSGQRSAGASRTLARPARSASSRPEPRASVTGVSSPRLTRACRTDPLLRFTARDKDGQRLATTHSTGSGGGVRLFSPGRRLERCPAGGDRTYAGWSRRSCGLGRRAGPRLPRTFADGRDRIAALGRQRSAAPRATDAAPPAAGLPPARLYGRCAAETGGPLARTSLPSGRGFRRSSDGSWNASTPGQSEGAGKLKRRRVAGGGRRLLIAAAWFRLLASLRRRDRSPTSACSRGLYIVVPIQVTVFVSSNSVATGGGTSLSATCGLWRAGHGRRDRRGVHLISPVSSCMPARCLCSTG
jgi:hypothetical protein